MARYQIELNGQPISMETWPTLEGAVKAMIAYESANYPVEGNLAVGKVPEQVGVSFGTPPTGGK